MDFSSKFWILKISSFLFGFEPGNTANPVILIWYWTWEYCKSRHFDLVLNLGILKNMSFFRYGHLKILDFPTTPSNFQFSINTIEFSNNTIEFSINTIEFSIFDNFLVGWAIYGPRWAKKQKNIFLLPLRQPPSLLKKYSKNSKSNVSSDTSKTFELPYLQLPCVQN